MSNVSEVAASTGLRTYEDYLESTRTANKTLGKSDFLQLLAAQLQYQNPLEPMSDSDFVAQLAQFSSLEQMETLNSTMSTYQYYGLAGKYVAADIKLDDGREGTIVGVVDSVFNKSGTSYSELGSCIFIDADGNVSSLDGNYVVSSSSVNQVYDSNLFSGESSTLLEAATLIGRTVTAYVTVTETVTETVSETVVGEDGEETVVEKTETKEVTSKKEISGVVTRVSMTEQGIAAYLDGSEEAILISGIVDIKQ